MNQVLPSQNYTIWQRLITRFTLKRGALAPYTGLNTLIQPVTSADDLLKAAKLASSALDISAATGYTDYHVVPTGKRWHLLFAYKQGTTGGSALRIRDRETTVRTTLEATGTTATYTFFHGQFIMEEGWAIHLNNTNNGADTSRTVAIWYIEEDAF